MIRRFVQQQLRPRLRVLSTTSTVDVSNKELLEQIHLNQTAILRHRQEDTIRGYINVLDECTSFTRAMETSRRALVFCGVEDSKACDALIALERDNPMGLKSIVPFFSLGVIVAMPAVVVMATYDPDGFFIKFSSTVEQVTGVDIKVHSWDTMEPIGFVAMTVVGLLVNGMTMGYHIRRLGLRQPGYRLEQLQVNRMIANLEHLNEDSQGQRVEVIPPDLVEAIALAVVRLDTVIYTCYCVSQVCAW
ncbi:hypothetical protein BASA81_010802 [Batrachochytrium salamandrivorans]|nr:hypothetical protein BASA81_010802 [Batrachochytrium salamandrivorans]